MGVVAGVLGEAIGRQAERKAADRARPDRRRPRPRRVTGGHALAPEQQVHVAVGHVPRLPGLDDGARLEQDGARAVGHDLVAAVGHEQNAGAVRLQPGDPVEALGLELDVADRQRLVDDQDVRGDADGAGEGEPDEHAARVELHRLPDEVADVREVEDRRNAFRHLRTREARQRTLQVDVLDAGEVAVEARAELEQRGDAPVDAHVTGRRRQHSRQDLQQGRFARAVAPDDAQRLAPLHRETHLAEGVELLVVLAPARMQRLLQPVERPFIEPVALGESPRLDQGCVRHTRGSPPGQRLQRPTAILPVEQPCQKIALKIEMVISADGFTVKPIGVVRSDSQTRVRRD